VLRLLAEGRTAQKIGAELHLSEATIKTHLHNLYEKLNVSDRAAAVATAMRWGLLE
jgi:two-component system nitrate/nitrite response regulator NarL